MSKLVPVKAIVPRELKCRVFSLLALRDERFSHWMQREMEALLRQAAAQERADTPQPPEVACASAE